MSWCNQWKGTPHDCIDHLQQKHSTPTSVKAATLGCWFPPWTVTRGVWRQALKHQVSGISTDVLLFSEYGFTLVHHYWVFGWGVAHAALRRPFMEKLRSFSVRAEAEAKWEDGRRPIQKAPVPAISDTLCGVRPRDPDDESPLCKSRRAASPIMPELKYLPVSRLCLSFRPRCSTLGQLHRILRELMVRHRYSRFSMGVGRL